MLEKIFLQISKLIENLKKRRKISEVETTAELIEKIYSKCDMK